MKYTEEARQRYRAACDKSKKARSWSSHTFNQQVFCGSSSASTVRSTRSDMLVCLVIAWDLLFRSGSESALLALLYVKACCCKSAACRLSSTRRFAGYFVVVMSAIKFWTWNLSVSAVSLPPPAMAWMLDRCSSMSALQSHSSACPGPGLNLCAAAPPRHTPTTLPL